MLSFLIFSVLFSNAASCVSPETASNFNLSEYIKHSWFVQMQQITGYQSSQSLNCVVATYNIDNKTHIPFFNGTIISVYNYANYGGINKNIPKKINPLCARIFNTSEPQKLFVSPCFLPNYFAGPYWVLDAGPSSDNYEWAIVGGGVPTIPFKNNTCQYKTTGFKNSGLWLFSRKQILDIDTINNMKKIVKQKNIDISLLMNVTQKGCSYINAFIK